MNTRKNPADRWFPNFLLYIVVIIVLVLIYSSTMMTTVSGGGSPYNDDTGEIQVALNVWGTVHMTGYPLFAMTGNLTVLLLRAVGVSAALAPALHSLLWGLSAFTVLYILLLRLYIRPLIAALATLTIGLSRTIWAHNAIAEVYSMSIFFVVLLLAVALLPGVPTRSRILFLALIGGFGVAHHRMVAFSAPGLIIAVLPSLWTEYKNNARRTLATILIAVSVALIGFLPYVYLPIRANANAVWVYGNPRDFAGLWHEFSGVEAAYLMKLPSDLTALAKDIRDTISILATELTPVGLVACMLLAGVALHLPRTRRYAFIAGLCSAGYIVWLCLYHRVVMPQAVAMPVICYLGFMAALGLNNLLDWLGVQTPRAFRRVSTVAAPNVLPIGLAVLVIIGALLTQRDWVFALTHEPTGVRAVALAQSVPRPPPGQGQSAYMLPWGPEYTAVAFSHYVTGENADLIIGDHNADWRAVSDSGTMIYTSKNTFYRFPLAWWSDRLGYPVALSGAADSATGGVTSMHPAETFAGNLRDLRALPAANSTNITAQSARVCRTADGYAGYTDYVLEVTWLAVAPPPSDYSVFVHLWSVDSDGPIAQTDRSAPVFGWMPTSGWVRGQLVSDSYRVATAPQAAYLLFGLYVQRADGSFINYSMGTLDIRGLTINDCRTDSQTQ